jgi:hypothetical protein
MNSRDNGLKVRNDAVSFIAEDFILSTIDPDKN